MKKQNNFMQKTNVISRYALILLAGFFLSVSSCKKKDNALAKDTPSDPLSNTGYIYEDDVYIAGTYTAGGVHYPAYWKNGQGVELLDLYGNKGAGDVRAIAVSGTDVYAVGYCSAYSKGIILWKNGKAFKVAEKSTADAIVVLNNDVYVVGSHMNVSNKSIPMYWKIDGNNSISSKDLTQGAYPNDDVYGLGIAVLNNKIYATGPISNMKAVLWTDDGTTISESILNNTSTYAYGDGIAVSGNDVYIGGTEGGTVKFWKNDKDHYVNLGTGRTSKGCIAIDDNNIVHMVGGAIFGNSRKAMYWKDGSAPVTLTTGSANEEANSIALAGNNVYITGSNQNDRSILWINGKKVPGFEGSQDINAEALFVVKK